MVSEAAPGSGPAVGVEEQSDARVREPFKVGAGEADGCAAEQDLVERDRGDQPAELVGGGWAWVSATAVKWLQRAQR
jgi:hypothetical protein